MEHWRDELGAAAIHLRQLRTHIKGRFYAARGRQHATLVRSRDIGKEYLEAAPRLAHAEGLKAYLYVALFDEG